MTWKGIKHNPVGEKMTNVEFHDEELHELAQGDTLPAEVDATDGDFFFKTDEKRLYIYIS